MRVALCLSGQTRTYEKCFDSQYNHIIKKYNCDVFIHTWTYNGLYPKTPDNLHYCKEYNINNYDKYLNNNYLIDSKIISLYNPKKILIEYPDKNFFISHSPSNNVKFFNAIMMYYSIYQSNQLKIQYENDRDFKYDIVIRCRFDLFFENFDIILDNNLYLAPNENIDKPFSVQMRDVLNIIGPKYMPNDQFSYGTSDAMDYYCNLYKEYILHQNNLPSHPEGLLSKYLWENNKYIPLINNNIAMKIILS